jgi:hypothetical protein
MLARTKTIAWAAAALLPVGALPWGAWAQEPGQSEAEARPPAREEPDTREAPREGASPAPGAEDLPDVEDDVFIPTEEIPADEEITFPVNI